MITYYLPSKANDLSLEILDASHAPVRTLHCHPDWGEPRDLGCSLCTSCGETTQHRSAARRGPQALPGIYTVRLTVNGNAYEQPLEIKLDPTLNVSKEDLRAQFDVTRDIARMQTAVSAALVHLAAIRGSQREQAESLAAQLARPANMRSETGPGLRENLDSLFTISTSRTLCPNPLQMGYYRQLQAQFAETMQKVNSFIETIPRS